ncbi:UPF0280 family protein [Roseospira navarrensis]|uniref:UPF0280 family protein n=1 Tax=Roseospira navarrensis TaxID=140058 RepID=A0A7X1ZEE6_9PROT|nr:UPF0280 family protein [Roseospira navarrensis]MQX36783.1 UPF0280 family protein [Roseospira navarrensis]
MQRASHRLLPDGRRLHLQHGPIDLIVTAEGDPEAVRAAYGRAVARFETLLDELVSEVPGLRTPLEPVGPCPLSGAVARRMWAAAAPFRAGFVTPMAAVAGAVAETVLGAIMGDQSLTGRADAQQEFLLPPAGGGWEGGDGAHASPALQASTPPRPSPVQGRGGDRGGPHGLTRAAVNNGGDIALWMALDAPPWRIGVVVDPARPASPGALDIGPDSPVRGLATSGRHGRSLSRGIADSVTVAAPTAAAADVAATLIGNAVDLPGHPVVTRRPARALQPDSDLGDRPVTVAVGALAAAEVAQALDAGGAVAADCVDRGLIVGAVLVLAGRVRLVGALDLVAGPAALPEPVTEDALHA